MLISIPQSCRDGTRLRDLDLNRQNCNTPNVDQVSLTNEHGDVFLRSSDYDDCGPISSEGYEDFPPNTQPYYNNQRPSPAESDYFYDQYVDFPFNDTVTNSLNSSSLRANQSLSPYVDFNNNKFTLHQFPPRPPQPTSAFTFFGQPLPSLNLGSIWGQGRTANTRATSGEVGTTRGKGRVQLFRPGDPELQVIFNRPTNELGTSDGKNREPAASVKNPVINQPMSKVEEKLYRPFFQTPFSQPKLEYSKEKHDKGFLQPKPERGFSPMIPGSVSGFIPIEDPTLKNDTDQIHKDNKQAESTTKINIEEDKLLKQVPLVTLADAATKRTIIKTSDNYMAQIEKVALDRAGTAATSTISHLQASLSPILSTLIPKNEVVTEKSHFDEDTSSDSESEETSHETFNKFGKITRVEEPRLNTPDVIPTSTYPSTTTTITYQTSTFSSSTTPIIETSSTEDRLDDNDGSSELSADHLIAPGSIITANDVTSNKPQLSLSKPGKITKVFTPAPPVSNSNEINKLLSPFYSQQQSTSSEPPINYDNEYQSNNNVYQKSYDDDREASAEKSTGQYEREDMQWYFQNYNNNNQTHSSPILNYNLQPYDTYGAYNSSSVLNSSFKLITLIVITFYSFC